MKAHFTSDLYVKLTSDTDNDGRGNWELLEPLTFYDIENTTYIVPAGFVTDFASVPRAPLAFLVAGCRGHRAATLHDYLCRTGSVPRELADQVFYRALLATGTSPDIARLMYSAVAVYSASLRKTGKSPWDDPDGVDWYRT